MNVISCKDHPTECLEILDGTIKEFVTNYLAENGRQIDITGKLYINDIIQFLALSDQAWVSGLPFIASLLDHVEATGWGGFNNSNQNQGGSFSDANRITNADWGASGDARTAYLPRSPVIPHTARRRVRANFLRHRRQENL